MSISVPKGAQEDEKARGGKVDNSLKGGKFLRKKRHDHWKGSNSPKKKKEKWLAEERKRRGSEGVGHDGV